MTPNKKYKKIGPEEQYKWKDPCLLWAKLGLNPQYCLWYPKQWREP